MKIDEAVIQLAKEYQNEDWFIDVRKSSDDGGYLIELWVNGYNYPKDDPIARTYCGFALCIVKRNIKIKGEKLT